MLIPLLCFIHQSIKILVRVKNCLINLIVWNMWKKREECNVLPMLKLLQCEHIPKSVFALNFVHLLARKPNLEKKKNYSNKFIHNFHLSESSFICPRLQASGLEWRLQNSDSLYICMCMYTSVWQTMFYIVIVTSLLIFITLFAYIINTYVE